MAPRISISKLRHRIKDLPPGQDVSHEGGWYTTHKQHWLRWLKDYNSPGAYGRKVTSGHDAEHVYNHVVNPYMLLYLIRQSGVSKRRLAAAIESARSKRTYAAKAGAIRAIVPWELVAEKLWLAGLDPTMPVLSVKQPWAEALMTGKKTIEYRPVRTLKKERVYIYASTTLADIDGVNLRPYGIDPNTVDGLPRWMIVGTIEIVDCTEDGTGHGDRFHWHVQKPRRLRKPVTPPKGARPTQTFWYLSKEHK